MRAFPTALSLSLLAILVLGLPARAECECVCANEQAVGICSQPYERPPICQQICTRSLSQALPTQPLDGPIAAGSVYGSGNLRDLARQLGVGVQRGPSSAVLPP